MLMLEARGLTRYFRSRAHPFARERVVRAVDGVDLHVEAGETLAVVGESGCGKSTLGRLLLRLIEPDTGDIWLEGRSLMGLSPQLMRPMRARMQMIFQDPFASLNPRNRVAEIIGEPLLVHGLGDRRACAARVAELMALVGLRPEHARRFPHAFSGGQRQRIGIARALAAAPKVLIADEPVSALDVSVQAQVLNLLRELKERLALTLVFISHDLAAVRHVSDRIAVMYLGQIVETAPVDALFAAPRHPYTQALMEAVPVRDPAQRRRRAALEGDMPSAAHPPPGCRFHTRCPHAQARCRVDPPHLALIGDGHFVACHFAASIGSPGIPAASAQYPAREHRLAIYRAALAAQQTPDTTTGHANG